MANARSLDIASPRGGEAGLRGTGGRPVVLRERYEIDARRPLTELDQPHAQAFAARDSQGAGKEVYALVCAAHLAPRLDIISTLARLERLLLVVPVDWDVIDWPPSQGRRLAIILRHPMGTRVQAAQGQPFVAWRQEELLNRLVRPLLPLLKALDSRAIARRAIRADNLYLRGGGPGPAVLGECVSAPAALDQPAIYETIEMATATPSGRGPGGVLEDLYALGALIAVLLSGRDPAAS